VGQSVGEDDMVETSKQPRRAKAKLLKAMFSRSCLWSYKILFCMIECSVYKVNFKVGYIDE
jgi:hypothetical protein